jgi:hypothetical protein
MIAKLDCSTQDKTVVVLRFHTKIGAAPSGRQTSRLGLTQILVIGDAVSHHQHALV